MQFPKRFLCKVPSVEDSRCQNLQRHTWTGLKAHTIWLPVLYSFYFVISSYFFQIFLILILDSWLLFIYSESKGEAHIVNVKLGDFQFYLLQAATVSQTDYSHAELFADSVQLCLGLLRQSAGGLIQHCKDSRKIMLKGKWKKIKKTIIRK